MSHPTNTCLEFLRIYLKMGNNKLQTSNSRVTTQSEDRMRVLSEKIFFLMFLTACLGGCCYQIFLLSKPYFMYSTTSKVESQMNFYIQFPKLLLCMPFSHLSPVKKTNLTISQMFHLTPSVNETLLSCKLRFDHKNKMQSLRKQECFDYFDVGKFFTGLSICYKYHPRNDLFYSITNVANAMTHPLIIYTLSLTKTIRDVDTIHVTNYFGTSDKFPFLSRKFSRTILKFTRDNVICFRTKNDNFTLLPPPYDTQCSSKSIDCYSKCTSNLTASRLNRHPFTAATSEPLDLQPLSYSDLANPQITKTWNQIEYYCRSMCRSQPCFFTVTSTDVKHSYASVRESELLVVASVPFTAGFTVTSVPNLTGIEYISGLCSTVGTWFGFSIISVRPSKWPRIAKYFKIKITKCFSLLNKKLLVTLNLLYILVCLSGYLFQTYQVYDTYFAYKTTSVIERLLFDYVNYYRIPSLSMCFPVLEMIDRSNHKLLGVSATPKEARDQYEDELAKLTVKEMINLTMSPEELIDHCQFRNGSSVTYYSKQDCLRRLPFTKAVTGGHVCYIANPYKNDTYTPIHIMTSLIRQREVYNLFLNRSLMKIGYVIAVVFDYNSNEIKVPLISRNFGTRITLQDPSKNKTKNFNLLGNLWFVFSLLPAPYETKCHSSPEVYYCQRNCLLKKYRSINRVPFSEMCTTAENTNVLSLKDVRNETIKKFVEETEHYCEEKCSVSPWFYFVSFTNFYHWHHSKLENMMFTPITESSPGYSIQLVPFLTIIEFIQFLCNPIGIWFGFSVLSLHPTNIKTLYRHYFQ